jgi:ribosomal protein S18 acetylase RimI-like enzyme
VQLLDASIELREEPFTEIGRYASVPNIFETMSVLDVVEEGGRYGLRERLLARPFQKDYDALEPPASWPTRFDTSNWILLGAFEGSSRIGGGIGAARTPGIDMLEGRDDLAVLWDLRISPHARRRGVGTALFRAIEAWAAKRQCKELKVETQNTNVAACNFYARQGCALSQVNRGAYVDLPDEIQLFWRKAVDDSRVA